MTLIFIYHRVLISYHYTKFLIYFKRCYIPINAITFKNRHSSKIYFCWNNIHGSNKKNIKLKLFDWNSVNRNEKRQKSKILI